MTYKEHITKISNIQDTCKNCINLSNLNDKFWCSEYSTILDTEQVELLEEPDKTSSKTKIYSIPKRNFLCESPTYEETSKNTSTNLLEFCVIIGKEVYCEVEICEGLESCPYRKKEENE